jgi:hypothetical protein
MLTSKGKLSAKVTTTLGLAATVAALWFAAATYAGPAVTSAQSTSAASTPASSTLQVQLQILRGCEEGLDYERLDSFEGMLSGYACVS